jgi:hypothetical protein
MNFIQRSVAPALWIAGASLVLAACATTPPPEYAEDHPANPAAPATSVPPASNTLATYKAFSETKQNSDASASPQPEQPPTESGHEHRD